MAARKPVAPKPSIPRGYEKGETSYKLLSEVSYWPKQKPLSRVSSTRSMAKAKPMEVKVVNPVRVTNRKAPTRKK